MSASSWPAYAGVMLVAGVGIPIMAALNGSLGARLASPATAAAILFAVGFAAAAATSLASGGPSRAIIGAAPWPYYMGGAIVAFYILSITAIGPRFGIANAVFFVILGQIVAATIIDHFGLFGAAAAPVTMQRAVGVTLIAIGALIARRPVLS